MFEREQREIHLHVRMPRKRWLALIAFAVALAIGVPVAWASFSDVSPSNPFYNDINAIQGAGITQGCGGGNFCPSANITREAEAAFVHRGGPRVAQSTTIVNNSVGVLGGGSGTVIGSVSIDVGGVAGGTQFVKVDATMTTHNDSNPQGFSFDYFIAQGTTCSEASSPTMVLTVPGLDDIPASLSWTAAVPSGATSTFVVCGYTSKGVEGITNLVLDATTFPFGSTGASALTASSAKTHP